MAVYATKFVSSRLIANALLTTQVFVTAYKGAMPANLNGVTRSSIQVSRANDILCNYGSLVLDTEEVDPTNYGWFMVTAPAVVNAVRTGALGWFTVHTALANSYANTYDFFACDSFSLPGGNGILQLNSLSFVAGANAPVITDFAFKL